MKRLTRLHVVIVLFLILGVIGCTPGRSPVLPALPGPGAPGGPGGPGDTPDGPPGPHLHLTFQLDGLEDVTSIKLEMKHNLVGGPSTVPVPMIPDTLTIDHDQKVATGTVSRVQENTQWKITVKATTSEGSTLQSTEEFFVGSGKDHFGQGTLRRDSSNANRLEIIWD